MHALIQGVIFGVLTGGVYALMASGQTLIFGIMKVINLAQGAMVILGAYLAYQLFTSFGIDPFLAIPITTVLMFGLGVVVQLAFLRPLRARGQVRAQPARHVRGGAADRGRPERDVADHGPQHQHQLRERELDDLRLPDHRRAALGVPLSLAVLGLLFLLLNRTRFGRAVRATVQNPESARLLGVEAQRVSALGFGLGAATAAAAGSVYGLVYPFNPGSHYDLISRLLSIVVLGGMGSVGGAVVAAVIVSTSSAIVASTVSPAWSEMTFFVILILVLLVRPQGLFGTVGRGAI